MSITWWKRPGVNARIQLGRALAGVGELDKARESRHLPLRPKYDDKAHGSRHV